MRGCGRILGRFMIRGWEQWPQRGTKEHKKTELLGSLLVPLFVDVANESERSGTAAERRPYHKSFGDC